MTRLSPLLFCLAAHLSRGRCSDFDGVGVFLAQRFAVFGEEGLALQRGAAHRAHKTGIMPGAPQGLEELVPRFDWEVTAEATRTEKGVIVSVAVGLSILQVEGAVADWLPTGSTQEAAHVPSLLQCVDHFPQDLVLAAAAGWGQELLVAVLAVNRPALLHEADVR